MPGSRQTQDGVLDVQISSIGLNSDDSSRAAKRMEVNVGLDSPRVNSGVPQVEQKLRVVFMPLLARTRWAAGSPTTTRSELGTTIPEANGAPLER